MKPISRYFDKIKNNINPYDFQNLKKSLNLLTKNSQNVKKLEEHFTPEKEHFTPEKEHFTPEKEHFTPENLIFYILFQSI